MFHYIISGVLILEYHWNCPVTLLNPKFDHNHPINVQKHDAINRFGFCLLFLISFFSEAYDKEKFVSYPGFNVEPPEDALDVSCVYSGVIVFITTFIKAAKLN